MKPNIYSITSSASTSRVGGMSMSSAFAVRRLMMNSNLLCYDGQIGRSLALEDVAGINAELAIFVNP
jgi:hypothetical protein